MEKAHESSSCETSDAGGVSAYVELHPATAEDDAEFEAMRAGLQRFTFEEFVDRFFDRPYGSDNESNFDLILEDNELREFSMWTNEAAPHVAWLFQGPEYLLDRYSVHQIGCGLGYLTSIACDDLLYNLRRGEADLEEGLAWIRAVLPLNQRLWAKVLPHEIYEASEIPAERYAADDACYMFWDKLGGGKSETALQHTIDIACIEVMRDCLRIENFACQNGALHGLGHWHAREPKRVEDVIDEFLASGRPANKGNVEYAREARTGRIL